MIFPTVVFLAAMGSLVMAAYYAIQENNLLMGWWLGLSIFNYISFAITLHD